MNPFKHARSIARKTRRQRTVKLLPDTPRGRIVAYLRRFQPKLYHGILSRRPDLIKGGSNLAGLSGLDGWFDDLMDTGTKFLQDTGSKIVDLYKQKELFKQQIRQATATPVRTIQSAPPQQVPINQTPIAPKTNWLIPAGIGAGIGLIALKFLGRKRR